MKTTDLNSDEKTVRLRQIYLIFEAPFFSLAQGVYTPLSHNDLVNIYRQIKNPRIKKQIKEFIEAINKQQNVETDIDTHILPRIKKEEPYLREVITFKTEKKV